MSLLVVGVVLDGGREESVDEGGLSQPRFSRNLCLSAPSLTHRMQVEAHHDRESRTPLGDNLVSVVSIRTRILSRSFVVAGLCNIPLVRELEQSLC
jgi:hypothetical protein